MRTLQQTVPKESLVPGGVYRLYHKGKKEAELAVFSRIGGTGCPIFHPLGEPDMQSSFALQDYGMIDTDTGLVYWVAIFERDGTTEDKGY
jgi:hypothetical protein